VGVAVGVAREVVLVPRNRHRYKPQGKLKVSLKLSIRSVDEIVESKFNPRDFIIVVARGNGWQRRRRLSGTKVL